ncbi:MAG TPA: DUF1080 domain-containing protein [Fimbriiglobus sp.]|nr:DUF1080 domain-containing protein [Fimbriiglobus sp.]
MTRQVFGVGLLLGLVGAALPAGAGQPDKDGWVKLFDGRSLAGWVQRGGKAKYQAENGMLVGTAVPNTPNSFLCTEKEYADFVLELEFNVDPNLNSGVQVRSHYAPEGKTVESAGVKIKGIPGGRVFGYQVEIDPTPRAFTGGVYDEGRRKWLQDLSKNEKAREAFVPNRWNALRIECRGKAIKTWVNNVAAASVTDDVDPKGFIALQVHGIGKKTEALKVRWRNIRLKELK